MPPERQRQTEPEKEREKRPTDGQHSLSITLINTAASLNAPVFETDVQ